MSIVYVTNVDVLDNPTAFTNPFQFEITFECLQELQDDLEWKIVYVGSAESQEHDQVLEEVMVGPVLVGVNKFVLIAPAPNPLAIPSGDVLGVTVILLSCSYLDNKFLQIGYYVNNDYNEPYDPESPPNPVEIHKVFRNILSNEPRVTRFPIDWTGGNASFPDAPVITEGQEEDEEYEDVDDEGDLEDEVGDDDMIINEDSMDVEQMSHIRGF
eukprot:gene340-607_t